MTDIAVSRAGRTVIAAHEVTGLPIRAYECRNVQCAVTLHWKLTSDQGFARRWAFDADPKPPEVKPHGLEREWPAL